MTEAPSFLTARWVHLAMVSYEVDPQVLRPWLPAGVQLDTFGGRSFVSVVGFQFLDTKVKGLAIPFHRNFEEVNLRFYVRRDAEEGVRRGVVFVKEIVPRAAIAWVARNVYNENYVTLPMGHTDEVGKTEPARVGYRWQFRGQTQHVRMTVSGEPAVAAPDSEEAFITEHYWGYAQQKDGRTMEYRVEHPPWRVWTGQDVELECDVAGLYGEAFALFMKGAPSSAFVADGSPVVVRSGRRLSAAPA